MWNVCVECVYREFAPESHCMFTDYRSSECAEISGHGLKFYKITNDWQFSLVITDHDSWTILIPVFCCCCFLFLFLFCFVLFFFVCFFDKSQTKAQIKLTSNRKGSYPAPLKNVHHIAYFYSDPSIVSEVYMYKLTWNIIFYFRNKSIQIFNMIRSDRIR